MADEVQYASGGDSNKRKYDDSEVRVRRPTGFSSPILPATDLPVSGIDAAKQRAQEIASRLYNDAEAKRPKIDNGGGFDSPPVAIPSAPKPIATSAHVANTTSSHQDSYSYQGMSKKIDVPNGRVGVIIGKGGETIKYLQLQSGAKIQVTRDMDADPNSPTRAVELVGTPDQITKAEQLISEVLAEAEAGGSSVVSRRVTGQAGSDQFSMQVPNNKVGLVIGKGGETIKSIQARTGARVQVIPLHPPPGDTSTERTVQIDGSAEQIEAAKLLVYEVISENRMRNSSMGGGYSQQGYQARAPQRWAPGPPQQQQQQPAYGYTQPGAYPGPQYSAPQPQYPGYPQQAGAGYPTSWDQSSTAPAQQPPQGTGYDYYSQAPQQQQQASGADNSYYNYNQQPPTSGYSSQGYPQDAYGGGYNTTKPPTDGHTPSYPSQGQSGQAPPPTQASPLGQQGYNMSQKQPNPNSGYAVPPTSHPGYGNQPPAQGEYAAGYGGPPPPQGHKPSANPHAYGQPQLSPSQGYAPPPTSYGAPPPTSYGAPPAQPGAYPGYSAPPATATYGQQPPPSYAGGPYGAPYSQAPVYPAADGNAGSNGAAVAGASPAVDPNIAAKASAPESK